MSVANIRKLQENTTALVQNGCFPIQVGAISGFGYVYPEKFETPSSPIRHHASDARHPGGKWRQLDGMAAQPGVMVAAAGCNGGGSRV